MKQQDELLGAGGFSSVYRPHVLREGQRSHVRKRPNPQVSQQVKASTLKKYHRQKDILNKLHERNPTKSSLFNEIYGFEQDQVLMKDLGNTDLLTVVRKHYDLLERDLDNVISQLIDAVVTTFRSGIVHRDIKLNNIMAQYDQDTGHYTITLIDFADGISRKEIDEEFNKFMIAGTKRFMSPELLHRIEMKRYTPKGTWSDYMANDLWSLGMVLYYLLYRRHLYDMFLERYPSLKDKVQSPFALYVNMKRRPDIYDNLFPIEVLSETKRKYLPLVRSLLSVNPHDRLLWLKRYHRQVKKKEQGSLSLLLKASQQVQRKQQEEQRRKSGLDLLLKAIQQKQKSK